MTAQEGAPAGGPADSASRTGELDAGEARFEFVLNGDAVSTAALDSEPLLYVLRDRLGRYASRFGCGLNQCGACAVLVDDRVVASCDLPMWAVRGREVITVEGLGSAGRLHPVQQALIEAQAGQCGYCLSGIVVTLCHLYDHEADADEARIRAAIDSHLCRCGAHQRIVDAALQAFRDRRSR